MSLLVLTPLTHSQEVTLKSFRNQIRDQSPQILVASLTTGKEEAAKYPRGSWGPRAGVARGRELMCERSALNYVSPVQEAAGLKC